MVTLTVQGRAMDRREDEGLDFAEQAVEDTDSQASYMLSTGHTADIAGLALSARGNSAADPRPGWDRLVLLLGKARWLLKSRENEDWETRYNLGIRVRRSLLKLVSARDGRGRRESTVFSRVYVSRVLFRCNLW